MQKHEIEIVLWLLNATQSGLIEWQPTDIPHMLYGAYRGVPYIVGMKPIPLDDSHEYYSYYVSKFDGEWKQLAYAEQDMMVLHMESIDLPIEALYDLALKISASKEIKHLREPDTKTYETKLSEEKPPKIFISHSSGDTLFVKALVNLLEQQGFAKEYFCSSIPGCGVKLGEDIFEAILNEFQQNKLYVLFVHSPRFYRSLVSLNEMGAAWALRTKYYSILTKDMSYDDMKAVVDDRRIAIKVDRGDAVSRVMELVHRLQDDFGKNLIDEETTKRQCEEFVQYANSLYYTRKGEVSPTQKWKVYLEDAMDVVLGLLGIKINR